MATATMMILILKMMSNNAAAQGLDAALFKLANFYYRDAESEDIAKDDQESLRLLLLSASQGYLPALFGAGSHYECLAKIFYRTPTLKP